ncbi:MAG: toxin HicA [Chloroflexi bacterium]|nr:MAG: toxin HicA [Chloroflexota bacterium]
MAKRDKLLERLRRNPHNVRFEEVDTILLGLGFSKRQTGTSHAVYTLGARRITVPFRKPFIKAVYVKQLLALLDEIEE